jgi:hypothetical protein
MLKYRVRQNHIDAFFFYNARAIQGTMYLIDTSLQSDTRFSKGARIE